MALPRPRRLARTSCASARACLRITRARAGAALRLSCRAGLRLKSALLTRPSYFAVTLVFWYFFNAVFAIFNKKTLNVFPYPWLLSWVQVRQKAGGGRRGQAASARLRDARPSLTPFPHPPQLACGAVFMGLVWALRIYPAPKVRASGSQRGDACA